MTEDEAGRLGRELERLRAENVRLSRLLELQGQDTAPPPEQLSAAVTAPGSVTMSSPVEVKLALYADRFRARTDVYALRWGNARTGGSGWMPAVAGGWRKGMDRRATAYLPFTADMLGAHLLGDMAAAPAGWPPRDRRRAGPAAAGMCGPRRLRGRSRDLQPERG